MIDDTILLGAIACSVYTAVCVVLVAIVIMQNDRINVLEAALGIVERKEYRLENELSAQERDLLERTNAKATAAMAMADKPTNRS